MATVESENTPELQAQIKRQQFLYLYSVIVGQASYDDLVKLYLAGDQAALLAIKTLDSLKEKE